MMLPHTMGGYVMGCCYCCCHGAGSCAAPLWYNSGGNIYSTDTALGGDGGGGVAQVMHEEQGLRTWRRGIFAHA